MKVVYIKNNKFNYTKLEKIEGFKFIPKRKNINSLTIQNNDLIKSILNIRIKKDIKKTEKTIRLMIKNSVTEISDCNLMNDEIKRIIKNINSKYLNYFNEFEYFRFIKELYILNNIINSKKLLITLKEL